MKGTRSYTPYGIAREITGSFNTDLGFIGRRQSDVTGLTYIRARYYDASTGRFTQIDPIQDGLNWYGYAGGNPVIYYDPTGLVNWSKTLGGVGHGLTAVGQWSVGTGFLAAPDPSLASKVGAGYCYASAVSHTKQFTTKVVNGLTEETYIKEGSPMKWVHQSVFGEKIGHYTYLTGDTAINIKGTVDGIKDLGSYIKRGGNFKAYKFTNINLHNKNYSSIVKEVDKTMGAFTIPGLINDFVGYKDLGQEMYNKIFNNLKYKR